MALLFAFWLPERLVQLWSVSLFSLSLLVFHVARWCLGGVPVTQLQAAVH